MKKTLRSILVLIFSLCMIFASVSMVSAANIGRVTGLKTSARTESSVTIKWSKVSNAKGYVVYRYNPSNREWKKIKTTSATSIKNTSLNDATAYSYRVKAYTTEDGNNVYGATSVTHKTSTAPKKVTGLKATDIGSDSITVSWNKVNGAEGYRVYKYNPSTGKYNKIGDTEKTSCIVKNLETNTTYKFLVKAYHKLSGTVFGANSSVLTVSTSLGDVKNFRLDSVTSSSYTLRWDKLSGASGYQLEKYNESKGEWVSLQRAATTKYTARDTGGRYRVRAYIKSGNTYTYGPYTATLIAGKKPSDVPENLKAALNSSAGISLKWSKVNGVAGYEIEQYDPQHGEWIVLGTTTKNSYNLKNLKETREYKFRVRAYVGSDSNKVYGGYCESVSIFFETHRKPDSIYSAEMEKSGILGYLYDPEEKCFYTSSDPWQRKAGFNSLYDEGSPFVFINYDTKRLRFEYDDRDWMIQIWKGQYGLVFYGAELGVYTKPKDRELMHYDCAADDDMLMMSMTFKQKSTFLGIETWKEKFTRPYGLYWWCTGFIPGNMFGHFDDICADFRVTMKDYDMLDAFEGALEEQGIQYNVKGLDVYFTF